MKLKGVTDQQEIKSEIATFIKDVDLVAKTNSLAKTLSGGQKRALSVAIALVGGSETARPRSLSNEWELLGGMPGRRRSTLAQPHSTISSAGHS